ncbi:MAG: 50S ribosomal protein L15 [candidate division Zixibacteria bacterium RBG_16_40_9]|nr:MAG: 50S ribosomal protein L15 [candidate division Zixibacteria bacterium RBG_16_40_9]
MLRLNELKAPRGASKKPKRIGRGPGSGHGKTSTKGHKGAKARSGYTDKPGFEGGQIPLQRRIPKRGFTNIFKKQFQIVNLAALEKCGSAEVINPLILKNCGLIKDPEGPVKILGEGEFKLKATIQAQAFSRKAQEKISQAGGKFEVIK